MIALWNSIDIYLKLFFLSMVPIIELRGAIIIAAAQGLSPLKSMIICIIGNSLPVPFLLLFLRKILYWFSNKPLVGKSCSWLINRSERKAGTIGKLEFIGHMLFVGVPLPGTGAWTGVLIAAALNMKLRKSAPAIILGVVIAGIIMTVASFGIGSLF